MVEKSLCLGLDRLGLGKRSYFIQIFYEKKPEIFRFNFNPEKAEKGVYESIEKLVNLGFDKNFLVFTGAGEVMRNNDGKFLFFESSELKYRINENHLGKYLELNKLDANL